MKATEELRKEHDAVLVALQILDRVAAAVATQDAQAPAHLDQLLDHMLHQLKDHYSVT